MTTSRTAGDGYTVRAATRADLLDVFRIEQESFPQPWPFAAFERFLDAPGFLVAERVGKQGEAMGRPNDGTESADGDIAGYVVADVVRDHGRDLGHIKDLAVAPAHRGYGVGSTLLTRALTILEAQGAHATKLEVRASNDRAISLYERFGFERRQRMTRYYEDDEHALVLIRDMNR